MIRISSLLLATGLAILPMAAFAQPAATPAPMGQPATTSPQMTKAPAPGVKTAVSTKDAKTTHAKLGTTAPSVPAKTAEPGKS